MSQNVFAQTGVSDAVYSFGEEVLAALEEAFSDYEGLRLIPFSSVTGEGVEELREILSSVAEEPEELG